MAYVQTRQVSVGELFSGTFDVLRLAKREVAIYCGVFLIVGLIADFVEALRPLISVVAYFGYFAAQYWLYRKVLELSGIPYDPSFKFFSMFFLAHLLGIILMFGWNLFLIPGILLGAKWIMAPTILVAEDRNLFQAMGDSWNASSNNLVALSIAYAVLAVGWMLFYAFIVGMVAGLTGIAAGGGGNLSAIGWVGFHLLPIVLMGLSVTAYRALGDQDNSLVAVFE
ncbi:MAG: hypothetical protein AAF697_05825 [Pseudomonadota bacterium]